MINAHSLRNWGDKELIKLLSKGNDAAFEEIYDRYWDKLFTVAANKLHYLSEAEEIVQDVFLDLWKRRETLEINSLPGYLSVAVKYKVIDRMSKRANQLKYQQHALHTQSLEDCSTENRIAYDELKARIGKHVANLPEKCRMVFELSRDEGLTQRQIALQLGIAEKTVESHLGKALRTLRLNLGELPSILFLPLMLSFLF